MILILATGLYQITPNVLLHCIDLCSSRHHVMLLRRLRKMTVKNTTFWTFLAIILLLYYYNYSQPSEEYTLSSFARTGTKTNTNKEVNNITITSQNIWLTLIPFVRNNKDVRKRLQSFAKGVSSSDIVLLQELFIFKIGPWEWNGNYLELTKFMREEGFIYLANSERTTPQFFGQNSGLLIYSKYPIIKSKSWTYEQGSFKETFSNKGYILAQIQVGKYCVCVGNTHLDSGDIAIRKGQLREIFKSLWDHIVHSPSLVVLAGDFNIPGNDPEFDGVNSGTRQLGLKEVFTEHLATYKDGTCMDHMFISQNVTVNYKNICKFVTVSNEPISDHYALWANLKLN